MRSSKKGTALLAGVAVAALVAPLTLAGSAAADPPRQLIVADTLSSGDYVGPLQFARVNGSTYVADSFTSHLWKLGSSVPLATGPDPKDGDIAGVAVNPDTNDVAYTTTNFPAHHAQLIVLHNGKKTIVGAIRKFEEVNNPDGAITYGVLDPDADSCFADTLRDNDIPVQYTGLVDAHPYAVAYMGDGAWAVADAGGNDILKVNRNGKVSVLKVIGRQPVVITQALADAQHLDACAVGKTYYVESVPTDVEYAAGKLYVSTLPGGFEGPGVPPGGRVWRLDPTTRDLTLLGGRFPSATNLAVSPYGTVYVAQPFAGLISVLNAGKPSVRMSLPGVAALEFGLDKHLYASTAPGLVGSGDPATIVRLEYEPLAG